MVDLLNFYPFNIRSGFEFLFLYTVFAIAGLIVLSVLRRGYGKHLDEQSIPVASMLRIGQVPSQEQYYSIAYLQRGLTGVAETLIAMAHACGAIQPTPGVAKHFIYVADANVPAQPLLRQFLDAVKPKEGTDIEASTIKAEAQAVARSNRQALEAELRSAGMIRSEANQSRVYSAVWLGGLVILMVGILRILWAISLGHRFLFLAVEVILVGLGVYLIARKSDEAPIKDSYLDWLRDTTAGLRLNVNTNWDTTPQAVGLGVAIDGAAILGTAAVAAGLVYAFHPDYDLFVAPAHAKTPLARSHGPSASHDHSGPDVDTSGSSSWSWSSSGGSDSGGGGSDSGGGGSDSGGGGSDGGGSSCGGGGGGGGCGGGGGGCGGGGGGGGCGGGGGGCGGGS